MIAVLVTLNQILVYTTIDGERAIMATTTCCLSTIFRRLKANISLGHVVSVSWEVHCGITTRFEYPQDSPSSNDGSSSCIPLHINVD